MSHLGLMVVYAACVSTVFGMLGRESPRDQWRLAGKLFAAFVVGAYAAGWAFYLIFR